MHVSIYSKNVNVTNGIEDRITKVFSKMDKFVPEDAELRVVLDVIKRRDFHKVEATLNIHGDVIRAECETSDLYDSINGTYNTLLRRVKKYNSKNRSYDDTSIRKAEVEDEPAFVSLDVSRVKPVALEVQSRETAAEQMELLGHSFHLFVDEETGEPAVMYRRNDGDCGILVTSKQ